MVNYQVAIVGATDALGDKMRGMIETRSLPISKVRLYLPSVQ